MATQELTVLIPVFNEEKCLDAVQTAMTEFLAKSPIPVHILFINDGSSDGSQAIIDAICHADARFRFIALQKNSGLSTALKAGIDAAGTPLIGYIDADLQTTPMDFLKLLEFIPEYDLVTGIRQHRQDGFVKRLSSKIANGVRNRMIHDGIEDTGCPLKIVKGDYLRHAPFFKGMHRFLPALVLMMGGKVKQVPVQHFPRFAGQAKYHLGNRLWGPFVDAMAFRWMQRRFIRYEIGARSK